MLQRLKRNIKIYCVKYKLDRSFVFQWLVKLNKFLFWRNKLEIKAKTYGDKNPEKEFFVVTSYGRESGLLALYKMSAQAIEYAVKKGYEPIIDMKNYECQYSTEDDVNCWDLFFKQPTESSLDEVYQSKRVYVQGTDIPAVENSLFADWENDLFNRERNEFIRKYCSVNEEIEKFAEDYCAQYDGLLGVFLRGTDYVSLKPKGHKVQPTSAQMFEQIDLFIKKYNINHIFLVTEDESIRVQFAEKYKELLLPNMGMTIANYEATNYLYKFIPENKKIANAKIYLEKLVILSKCDYLVSSIANGSAFAISYSEGFKDHYIYDLGEY